MIFSNLLFKQQVTSTSLQTHLCIFLLNIKSKVFISFSIKVFSFAFITNNTSVVFDIVKKRQRHLVFPHLTVFFFIFLKLKFKAYLS